MLGKSPKFKKAVLKELSEAKDDLLRLKPHIRKYIELLTGIHDTFRQLGKKLHDDAQSNFEAAHKRFEKKFPEEARIGVVAIPLGDRDVAAGEHVYLTPPMIKYLPYLHRLY